MLSKISPIEENKRKSACDRLQNPLFKLKQKDFIIKVIFACVSLLKIVYNTSEYRLPKAIIGVIRVCCATGKISLSDDVVCEAATAAPSTVCELRKKQAPRDVIPYDVTLFSTQLQQQLLSLRG